MVALTAGAVGIAGAATLRALGGQPWKRCGSCDAGNAPAWRAGPRRWLGSPLGSRRALTLADRGALATHYYALAHPSLPNYLALTTGSTQGVTSDCNSCDNSAPSLRRQLEAAIPWKAHFESIPRSALAGNHARNTTRSVVP